MELKSNASLVLLCSLSALSVLYWIVLPFFTSRKSVEGEHVYEYNSDEIFSWTLHAQTVDVLAWETMASPNINLLTAIMTDMVPELDASVWREPLQLNVADPGLEKWVRLVAVNDISRRGFLLALNKARNAVVCEPCMKTRLFANSLKGNHIACCECMIAPHSGDCVHRQGLHFKAPPPLLPRLWECQRVRPARE